jgi:LIVCS family branched-chain amino acid:cation transporter
MKRLFRSDTVATGMAIFSMFFGAGNVVFPLVIGRHAGDKNIYAVIGFLLSAVCVPFLGLVAMVLFGGDYKKFFSRLGKLPGSIIIFFLMALIGPLAAIPRCIALSYTTVKSFLPGTTLFYFSLISCALIYLLAMKKARVVHFLGKILSPILLVSLLIIIVKGFIGSPSATFMDNNRIFFFFKGLLEGYNTMDIFAAFFFSAVVIASLKLRLLSHKHDIGGNSLVAGTLRAGLIGLSLLGLIYTGFSYVSAFFSEQLSGIEPDALISSIAFYTLGPLAGFVACVAVSLACLTTAIALSVVFADFLRVHILSNKIRYQSTLLISMVVTFAVSNIGFAGIVKIIAPVLYVLYPAIIVLAIANIAHKIWGIETVKIPVFVTFVIALIYRML